MRRKHRKEYSENSMIYRLDVAFISHESVIILTATRAGYTRWTSWPTDTMLHLRQFLRFNDNHKLNIMLWFVQARRL